MRLKLELLIEGEMTRFELDTDELARNYDDETYAYWIVEDKRGYIHEINIWKDERGNFMMFGKDYVWYKYGDFEDLMPADFEKDVAFGAV